MNKTQKKGKKMNKKIIALSITLTLFIMGSIGLYNKATGEAAKTQPKNTETVSAINTTSLNIVQNPAKYLNKTVKMQATFDKFSTLGLDYSKAKRESTKYISILIQRDDISDHNIPLSEMKLFIKKEMAEKHIDLDTGDKIEITAKEFSTALGDPWLDVEELKVIKKVKKEEQVKQ